MLGEAKREVILAALWLLVVHLAWPKTTEAAFAGPYWMKFRTFANCPAEEVGGAKCDACISSVMRYNHSMKTQVMDGNVTLSNSIFFRGETILALDVARWNSVSGWREHFLVLTLGELCFVYEDFIPDIVRLMAEYGGVPTKCPLVDGVYGGQNFPTQFKPLNHFPQIPYGRYRVYTLWHYAKRSKSNGLRSCMKIVVDIIPRT